MDDSAVCSRLSDREKDALLSERAALIELSGGAHRRIGRVGVPAEEDLEEFRRSPVLRSEAWADKAWRTKFFVFLEDPDVPPTDNACEREIRPSVVFRNVSRACERIAHSRRHRFTPSPAAPRLKLATP